MQLCSSSKIDDWLKLAEALNQTEGMQTVQVGPSNPRESPEGAVDRRLGTPATGA